jgi:nitrogen fixation NifU-like protein
VDLYADNILDHYRAPRKKGEMPHASISHTEKNLSCGDVLSVHLHIDDRTITEIAWQGEGCAISQAAMSMLAEMLAGKSIDDIDALNEANVRALLGVPVGPRRVKCALLGLHTLKNALHLKRQEPLQGWMETVGNEGGAR